MKDMMKFLFLLMIVSSCAEKGESDLIAFKGNDSVTITIVDQYGSGLPIHEYDLFLAGHQSWTPGTYTNNLALSTMPDFKQASILFKSDSRLKIRFQVKSQEVPTASEEYCFGRNTVEAADKEEYTKLKFDIKLRDILCKTTVTNAGSANATCPGNDFELGVAYGTQSIGAVSVDNLSGIIDLGSSRNNTDFGTAIEVTNVKSDNECLGYDSNCPTEKIVKAGSCWHMKMYISTDYTKDFQ